MVAKLFLAILGWVLIAFWTPVYAIGDPAQISDIVGVIGNIIKLLAPMTAIAFFVMLLWGGFQFLTSGGDPKSVAAARTTLTIAIIGVILVIAAWLILLLIENITGVDVTTLPF